MNHYVYFITNEDKMKYIGVRSSECNPEEDTKYWGSSKHIPKDISETGVKEIVEVFDTRKEAVTLEIELHDKWNVAVNPWFYNQAKQTSTGFDVQGMSSSRKGVCRSEETKAKISKATSGRTKENHPGVAAMAESKRGRTKENHPGIAAQAEKLRGRTKNNNPGTAAQAEKLRGYKHTEETKKKMSAAKMGNTNCLGKKHSIQTKMKIKVARSRTVREVLYGRI